MLRSVRIALLAVFALWEFGNAFQFGATVSSSITKRSSAKLMALNTQYERQEQQYRLQPEAATTVLQILQQRISDGNPLEPHVLKSFSAALENLVEEVPQPVMQAAVEVAAAPPKAPPAPPAQETSRPAFLDQMALMDDPTSSAPQGMKEQEKEEVILPEGAVAYDFGDTEVYVMEKGDIYVMEKGDISPIGGTIWEGGLILASYLKDMEMEYFGWLADKRFIDLGSGTGICGIMAFKFGAKGLLTDQNRVSEDGTSLFDLMQENINLNVKDAQQIGEDDAKTLSRAQICDLHWGRALPQKVQDFKAQGPIDFIFCGDLLYQRSAHMDLLQTIQDLAGPETTVLVAYPDRGSQEEGFARRLQHHGFDIEYIINDTERKVYLYSAKLAQK